MKNDQSKRFLCHLFVLNIQLNSYSQLGGSQELAKLSQIVVTVLWLMLVFVCGESIMMVKFRSVGVS